MASRITDKQKKFVDEYLIDLNATQAAIRAGYSKNTARSIGKENLTKPDIASAIKKAQAEISCRTKITQDMVVSEIGKVAFHDAADYADSELKYSNKLRALELLGKHLGIFAENTQADSAALTKLDEILEEVRADAADSEAKKLHNTGE